MKKYNRKHIGEIHKTLNGRLTIVTFNNSTKERVLTQSRFSLVSAIQSIATYTKFGVNTLVILVDLPEHLDEPKHLTNGWVKDVAEYQLDLYI